MNSTVVCTKCGAMSVDQCSCTHFGGTKKEWPPKAQDKQKEIDDLYDKVRLLREDKVRLFSELERVKKVANDQAAELKKCQAAFYKQQAGNLQQQLKGDG